jgi:hypothetical protein
MKSIRLILVALSFSLPSGWNAVAAEKKLPEAAKVILDKANQIELYSLDPEAEPSKDRKEKTLHGWKILGKTTLKKDDEAYKTVLGALGKGIAGGRRGAKCFEPRHAIRASHEGKDVDLLVCFECRWVYVYFDGKKEEAAQVLIDKNTQPEFDKVLKAAGVPLPKKRKE